ncbi:MAG: hypothetical protein LDL19_07640 [Thiobacillus sp.]|nr:hypothetical protein [Thiobacillus sp.]
MGKLAAYIETLGNLRPLRAWLDKDCAGPSPAYMKRRVLARNAAPDSVWIETGTFLGETTRFLAGFSRQVYSIEPDGRLFEKARANTRTYPNISVLHGSSEALFSGLCDKLEGNASFWLDGHYSAENTYQGSCDTPIRDELAHIAEHLGRLGKISVMVDDVRCFDPEIPEYAAYPTRDWLVDWARSQKLKWHIEHDIFIARNF